MIEKMIVFGGSGFIGGHVLSTFLNKKVNFDISSCENPDNGSFFIQGDTREVIDSKRFTEYLGSSIHDAVIFNLVAIHKTPGHEYNEYFETNIKSATNVCKFARENNISTIVFTSSIAPYGPGEDMKSEDTMLLPNSAYGMSKIMAENIHRLWQAEDPVNRKLIILRPGIVFGLGEGGNFTRLYDSLGKGLFFYPGRNDTKKSSIYVKDLVRLSFDMIRNETAGVSLYNMCYPHPYSIKEIVNAMCRVTSVNKPLGIIPAPLLKIIATFIYAVSIFFKNGLLGIHPDRVKKLMISTNISGERLESRGYIINYSIEKAIADWYKDNNEKRLA
jgi:GlcNAc-P-P-Und epimerase